MTDHPLVTLLRKAVKPNLKPCVNISGGIDSTVLLHHLVEQTDEPVHTYTLGFDGDENEYDYARNVAEHYGTVHHEVTVSNMLSRYADILKDFPYPHFNLWPWWVAQQQNHDQMIHCYIAEGGDEHFGGYWYKPRRPYVEHWQGFYTYVLPTYQAIYDHWCLKLMVPFHPNNLSWDATYPYYDDDHNKRFLRSAYRKLLPPFVINRKKCPGRFDYWVIWRKELQPFFPNTHPTSEDDIRQLLNKWVTREWLKAQAWEPELLVPS